MKIFITWSGSISLRLARCLRDLLPEVLPYVKPWVSTEDINKGTRWTPQLWVTLRSSEFGILCLVAGNEKRPWVLFESGVLACAQAEDRVAPFLVGLQPSDLPEPLGLFQCVRAEREDVLRLLKSINDAGGGQSVSEEDIEVAFRECWPRFRQRLRRIEQSSASADEEIEDVPSEESNEGLPLDSLDVVAKRVLVALANSTESSETAYSMALTVGRSERLIRLKLKDLEELGFVRTVSAMARVPYYSVTEEGLRALDKRGLVH